MEANSPMMYVDMSKFVFCSCILIGSVTMRDAESVTQTDFGLHYTTKLLCLGWMGHHAMFT